MIKLNLTLGERMMVNKILNEKGENLTLLTLRASLKIVDKVAIEEAEFKKAGLEFDKKTNRQSWRDKGSEADIEFSNDEVLLLTDFINKKDAESKFSISEGKFMVSLIDKVKGSEDEK